jgi:RNA polymerase sigma-70 factor (ECF subfamily)
MTEKSPELTGTLKPAWQRFLDSYEPLRPELYKYCRYLTRSPWDAEDLVQDTFARAFVTLGCLSSEIPNPKAWLLRVASNLWIDRMRTTRAAPEPLPTAASEPRVTREAAGTLISRLSPQERAAVVLKDAFDLSLEEIAQTLTTSVGAVKAALHRGRGKLAEPVPENEPLAPHPQVLDAFCAAFNAGDVDRLAGLLMSDSIAEIVGINTEYGPEASRKGSFWGSMQPLFWSDQYNCGIQEKFLDGYRQGRPRAELRTHRGETIVLFWYQQEGGEVVRDVGRAEVEGDHISRWRNYFFSPDVTAEICRELGVPSRPNGYTYWRKS